MYRALYRKWRPLRFADVVGQQAIITALQNQIASGHVGHAYLFTGVRGTGKTSCAKIFAKAVNCTDSHSGDPCCVCEACRGIDNGSILDVVEMDAASNNGIDNIRDLRDETAYTPSTCRYKVYIIDEVHMLSTQAFNALLKTLEEPPPHVIFILATTEIQKVPATILSRCQRYDFTRIANEDLAARARFVASEEGFALDTGAADLIARLADGALRDTLSILDTCAGVTTDITEEIVRRMAGVTDKAYLFRISGFLAAGDGVSALAELADLRQKSVDLKRLAEELIQHYRNLLLAGISGGDTLLSGVSPDEETTYRAQCGQMAQSETIRAIRTLGSALEKMTRGGDQRIELELALFQLSEPKATPTAAPAVAYAPTHGQAPATPHSAAPFASAPIPPAAQPFASAPVAPAVTSTAPSVPAAPVANTASPAPVASTAPIAPPAPPPAPTAQRPASAPMPEDIPIPDEAPPPEEPPFVPPHDSNMPAAAQSVAAQAPKATKAHAEDAMASTAPITQSEEALPWDAVPLSPVPPSAPERAEPQISQSQSASQAQAAPQAPAPPASAPSAAQTAAPVRGTEPFAPWNQILAQLATKDPLLHGYVKKSHAYYDGKRVLIEGGSMFRDFLRANKSSQTLIKQLIFETTGIQCAIGPYDPRAQAQVRASAEDSLHALEAKGLSITIEDSANARTKSQ